ncbi:MAG: hypothetical protein QOD84_2649 [Acidobacteriaceae bacterium]|jgi:hypothetical protein
MRRIFACVLLLVFSCLAAAKDQPFQVVTWPESGQPVLRFSFSKFKEIGGIGKEHTYVTEVSAENLSPKTINGSIFNLYVFDRSKARVSEGFINLSNVPAGQTVRFQVTLAVSGIPASVSVATAAATTNTNAPRPVSITVNSVPQGAAVKLDGKELGTTPRTVEIAIGQHMKKKATIRAKCRSKSPPTMLPEEV